MVGQPQTSQQQSLCGALAVMPQEQCKAHLRGKMQEVPHGAAFTLFLCCGVSMGGLGAHWDIRWRWPGAAELEIPGVQSQGAAGELW